MEVARALAAQMPTVRAAYQARPCCDGDGIDLVKGNASFIKGSLQRGEEGFKVSAGGNFGDDATVAGVLIHR